MNVLMVESHYRSRSWFKALKDLANLHIISMLGEERRLFLSNGVPENKILNLHNPDLGKIKYDEALSSLTKYEEKYNFLANQIVLTDRTLRRKDIKYVTKYLYFLILLIEEFISKNHIKVVFIEPTWTHEILICKICKAMGVPVWALQKSKLMPDKFFFFSGYKNEVPFNRNSSKNLDVLGEELLGFLEKKEKPQYFEKYNRRSKLTWSKFNVLYDITKLALKKDKNYNIQPSWVYAVKKKLGALLRAKFLMHQIKFYKTGEVKGPYILVTLHVQPEASIDVVGEQFADQVNFVRSICRTTPVNYTIAVKEHSHAYGDRDLTFYRKLSELPNVNLISPWEESRKLIQNAKLVISNTGTSSYEAALMGVPGVTATKMYFHKLMVCPEFNPNAESVKDLLSKADIWSTNFNKSNLKKELGSIQKDLFDGNSGDFKIDSKVMDESNIILLKRAFLEVLSEYEN